MGTLLTLAVKFAADVEQAKKNIDSVKGSTEKLKTSLTETAKIGAGIAAAGIGAVTTAAGYALNKTMDWAETLDGVADHLATTSEESAGLALMVERVGGSTDQLISAMDIMTRGLTNAKGELGPTGLALQQLGVSATDATGAIKDAPTLFQEVANAIMALPPGLGQTAAMMDVFGKSGGDMGDILAAAADGGVKRFQEEAGKLGLAMSQENVDKVINAKKQWDELKKTWDGIVIQLGTSLLPMLGDLLVKVQAWVNSEEGRKTMQDVSNTIKDFAINAERLFGWLLQLNPETIKLGLAIGEVSVALKIALPLLTLIGGPVAWLIGAVAALTILWANLGSQVSNTAAQIILIMESVAYRLVYNVFGWINSAIANTIGWVQRLYNQLINLRLPDWLTPGSPTPLEMGIRGINSALKDSVSQIMPQFQAQLSMANVGSPTQAPVVQQQSAGIDYEELGRVMAYAVRDQFRLMQAEI